MKRLLSMVAAVAVMAAVSISTYAGTWETDSNGLRYKMNGGEYAKEVKKWIDSDGDGIADPYVFDENGYLLTNGFFKTLTGKGTLNADITTNVIVEDHAYSDSETGDYFYSDANGRLSYAYSIGRGYYYEPLYKYSAKYAESDPFLRPVKVFPWKLGGTKVLPDGEQKVYSNNVIYNVDENGQSYKVQRFEDTVTVSNNGKIITVLRYVPAWKNSITGKTYSEQYYEIVYTLENNKLFPGQVYHYRENGSQYGYIDRDYYIAFDENNKYYACELRSDGKSEFSNEIGSDPTNVPTLFEAGSWLNSSECIMTETDWIRYNDVNALVQY